MTVFVKFWTPLYMRGTLAIHSVSTILRGAKYFLKYCTLADFRESTTNFSGFIPIFGKFWTPPLYGGYPWHKSGPHHSQGIKRFHQVFLTFQFSERYEQYRRFYSHFCEILNPLYMGSTPKYSPIGFTLKLDLLVVLKSICANFGSDSSSPLIWKVFTEGQTDGHG